MRAVLHVFFFLAGCSVAFASDSAITEAVASVDWQHAPLELVDPKANPSLLMTVEFEREGTWRKQKDKWALAPREKPVEGKPIRHDQGYWGYGKGWGNSGGDSGSGIARPGNFNKDGFDVVLSLKWSLKSRGEGEFNETLPCKWVPEQTFEKDGFIITVTVKANR
jgi:hypothetical protein